MADPDNIPKKCRITSVLNVNGYERANYLQQFKFSTLSLTTKFRPKSGKRYRVDKPIIADHVYGGYASDFDWSYSLESD